MVSPKSGSEYAFEHLFKGKDQAEVYKGIIAWLKGEQATVTQEDGKSTIVATLGGRRIFGSEHPLSQKNVIFVIATTAEGVVVTATMSHPRNTYDSRMKQSRVKAGWGYLANTLWALIEGGELAKKYLHPIEEQRRELERTEGRVKRKIAIWSMVEVVLVVGEFFLGESVQGDIMGSLVGIAWLTLLIVFFCLLLPLIVWLGILTNVRYALKRVAWREDLGLKY